MIRYNVEQSCLKADLNIQSFIGWWYVVLLLLSQTLAWNLRPSFCP